MFHMLAHRIRPIYENPPVCHPPFRLPGFGDLQGKIVELHQLGDGSKTIVLEWYGQH